MSHPILRLAVPTAVRRLFDYLAPADCDSQSLMPGTRVRVQFRNRELIALLIEIDDKSDFPIEKLKPALEVLDSAPPLPRHLFDIALWAAKYYQHPVGDALQHALPTLLRKGAACEYAHEKLWFPILSVSNAETIPNRAKKQLQLLKLVQEHPQGISADAIRAEGGNTQLLKKLSEKKLVEERHIKPKPWIDKFDEILSESPLTLNQEQQAAVDQVANTDTFNPVLLEGITGSGKTEVYLQIIETVLRQQKQALVLVPEIGLTPQTIHRFQQRFRVPIVALHSNMTDRQRLDAWLKAKEGVVAIVIGTRSALLTPLDAPGVIIIDEEHDSSYKQQDGFRYSARDLAIVRAQKESIPIVLGTATPALETLWNAKQGKYNHLKLTQRAGNATPPSFELLDIKQQPVTDGFSTKLLRRISETLEQGNQVLIFLNRRGFAPTLSCQHCGAIEDCHRCDAHMTFHLKPAHLHCHHCDSQRPIPRKCRNCGSDKLVPVGSGTERSEYLLEKVYPNTPIIRVDRDTTQRKDALANIMKQVRTGEPCILIGTQMLAKGHHFPDVTLVAILNADGGLFSADFRGMERTAQLLVQVAGRAGRADKPGHVILQTMHADHPAVGQLVECGYSVFANEELHVRKQSNLPPFSHMALLRAEASTSGRAEAFLRAVREHLQQQGQIPADIQCVGPIPSVMEKRAGVYRAQLLLQSVNRPSLHSFLNLLCAFLETTPHARKVRWIIDVDPIEVN